MSEEQKILEGISDPANLRKMSEPFQSPESADIALDGFWKEFYELRNKWRIANVYVIVNVSILYPEGEGTIVTRMMAGDELKAEPMTAWAFGHEQAARQEMLARVLGDAMKAVKKRKVQK